MRQDKKPLQHVAIIMDGNRRWAASKGCSTLKGHEQGAETLRLVIREAIEHGISYLTVYGFSSENWGRSSTEVDALMLLMHRLLSKKIDDLHAQGVRLCVIGDLERFPQDTADLIRRAEAKTADNKRLCLTVALSYGARQEIVQAARTLASRVASGILNLDEITVETFAQALYTKGIPDPDLFIRPGGEQRISNFLLWQISYAELYFTQTYWPDFSKEDFRAALAWYYGRSRRFGLDASSSTEGRDA